MINFNEDVVCKIFAMIVILLFIFMGFAMYKQVKYCDNNPSDKKCNYNKETTSNNNNGIKCGYVFGHGYKCGVGF